MSWEIPNEKTLMEMSQVKKPYRDVVGAVVAWSFRVWTFMSWNKTRLFGNVFVKSLLELIFSLNFSKRLSYTLPWYYFQLGYNHHMRCFKLLSSLYWWFFSFSYSFVGVLSLLVFARNGTTSSNHWLKSIISLKKLASATNDCLKVKNNSRISTTTVSTNNN